MSFALLLSFYFMSTKSLLPTLISIQHHIFSSPLICIYFDEIYPVVLWQISSNLFIYCLQTQQFYLLNPTLHATCFGRPGASSGIKIHHLKPKWTCVKRYCDMWDFKNVMVVITLDYYGFLFLKYLFVKRFLKFLTQTRFCWTCLKYLVSLVSFHSCMCVRSLKTDKLKVYLQWIIRLF